METQDVSFIILLLTTYAGVVNFLSNNRFNFILLYFKSMNKDELRFFRDTLTIEDENTSNFLVILVIALTSFLGGLLYVIIKVDSSIMTMLTGFFFSATLQLIIIFSRKYITDKQKNKRVLAIVDNGETYYFHAKLKEGQFLFRNNLNSKEYYCNSQYSRNKLFEKKDVLEKANGYVDRESFERNHVILIDKMLGDDVEKLFAELDKDMSIVVTNYLKYCLENKEIPSNAQKDQ
ncbi:hypothetical protein ACFP65_09505 [Marinilactibacillus sp. GCM10026970]|uniref:hypothetical protein n=1 Tax=Marinilactibacillus sp. GCM10026970 TaxID=3252642 RepID=UPI00360871D4